MKENDARNAPNQKERQIPGIRLPPELIQKLAKISTITTSMQESIPRLYIDRPEIVQLLERIATGIKDLPLQLKQSWATAVENGWYPNAETTAQIGHIVDSGKNVIDDFMISHLHESWDSLKTSILSAHPDRSQILECAFKLHEEGHYIASVPLFISQSEGIIADKFGISPFMEKKQREEKISEITNGIESFDEILLSLLGISTQLHAGSRESSADKKNKAPNRNGIMHGSRKHLDYGTEINSLKSFSLLAYASFITSPQVP